MAGVDEAGRGPLAGPVVAAAVVLDQGGSLAGQVADSKQLSARQRADLFSAIMGKARAVGIGIVGPSDIDRLNILQATMLAMKRAIDDLSLPPTRILVDGNRCPETSIESEAVIGGDKVVPAISAASIIAKVTRDEMMLKLHASYPQYGFDSHKGYPTKQHKEALSEFGATPEHRRSFAPVKAVLADISEFSRG